jgi:(2Fe-2S) ferredoxin
MGDYLTDMLDYIQFDKITGDTESDFDEDEWYARIDAERALEDAEWYARIDAERALEDAEWYARIDAERALEDAEWNAQYEAEQAEQAQTVIDYIVDQMNLRIQRGPSCRGG